MGRWYAETAEERFWIKVDQNGPVPEKHPELGQCWLWTGSLDGKGYGEFLAVATRQGRRKVRAHRFSWELEDGPIPDGREPDHLCEVIACIRRTHLELVTHRENVLRGHSPAAMQARQESCINEHDFTEANTRITPAGRRKCRACHRANERKRREKRSRSS